MNKEGGTQGDWMSTKTQKEYKTFLGPGERLLGRR